MCREIETNVIMAKINACMVPTKISRNKKGNGIRYGAKKETIVSKTSPAKILPKSRKESETTLVNSPTNSRKPTYRLMGLREKYLPRYCFMPSVLICKNRPIIYIFFCDPLYIHQPIITIITTPRRKS